ncbi:DUF5667 domain-containing protein [Clostridium omnivorum]|uniref:DUF5667 domain-containing protein n=1 Tax=Clostridium omnivorum TaxID=1604902 RepID=A0ABQ5NB45_9CLOT|nr:DUF5667 domain-containing protein [Clostridium sp. E14]GLC32487.1 hypothetical protein bsdE14_38970 [Clostridium sp. E14]
MKIKKLAVIIALAVSISGGGIKAFAEDTVSLSGEAGITPDSIFYPIDKAIDNLKVIFTKGDADKAEALEKIAEERLGESEVMTQKGKTKDAKEALDSYVETIGEVQDKLEAAEKNGQQETDKGYLEELQKVEESVAEKQQKSIEVLTALLDKAPENAKENLTKVIEMQTAKKEAVDNMVKERQEYNAAKKQYNTLKEQLEAAKKSGDAETTAKLEEELKTQGQVLAASKDDLQKAIEVKKAVNKDVKVGESKKEEKKSIDKKEETESTNVGQIDEKDNNKAVETKKSEETNKNVQVQKTQNPGQGNSNGNGNNNGKGKK